MTTVETDVDVTEVPHPPFQIMLVTGVAPNLNSASSHNQHTDPHSDVAHFLDTKNILKADRTNDEPLVQKSLRHTYFNELEKAYFNGANAFIFTLKMTGYYKGTLTQEKAHHISKTAFDLATQCFKEKYGKKQ